MKMKTLTSLEEFYNTIEQNSKVVVYWYTSWCPDCFSSKQFLPQLEKDFSDYTFVSCDRDDFLDLAKHLEIYGIPSFLVFKDGEGVGRLVSKNRKTYIEVKEFLDKVTS